jgi:hypothetical protein
MRHGLINALEPEDAPIRGFSRVGIESEKPEGLYHLSRV